MDKIIGRLMATNFAELKGAFVEARVPVPQSLINEIVSAALEGNKNIDALQITIHPANRAAVQVRTVILPWPLDLRVKIDSSVDLASHASPKIRIWLENNRLLGSLGAFFNALPRGVKVYGDQVVIDLGAFLQSAQQKRMLELVKSVKIATEAGRVILDIRLEADK